MEKEKQLQFIDSWISKILTRFGSDKNYIGLKYLHTGFLLVCNDELWNKPHFKAMVSDFYINFEDQYGFDIDINIINESSAFAIPKESLDTIKHCNLSQFKQVIKATTSPGKSVFQADKHSFYRNFNKIMTDKISQLPNLCNNSFMTSTPSMSCIHIN